MIDALAPVALLIGLGYLLRASGFLPEASWSPIDRLVYYVLFPALLVTELAAADLAPCPRPHGGGAARHPAGRWPRWPPARQRPLAAGRPGLHQRAAVRGALEHLRRPGPGAGVLFGAEAMPLVALAVAVMVPAANVMSVAALARHGRAGPRGARPPSPGRVATNPLIVACAAGRRAQPARARPAIPAPDPLAILGRATLALGLLTVGAGLRPTVVADRPCVIAGHHRGPSPAQARRWRRPGAAAGPRRHGAGGGGARLRRADRDLLLHPGPAARRRRRADGGTGHHDHGRSAGHAAAVMAVARALG